MTGLKAGQGDPTRPTAGGRVSDGGPQRAGRWGQIGGTLTVGNSCQTVQRPCDVR